MTEFKKLTASLRELGQTAKFGSALTPSTPELLTRLELASLVRERKTDEAVRFLQQNIASSARSPDAPASSFKWNLALAQVCGRMNLVFVVQYTCTVYELYYSITAWFLLIQLLLESGHSSEAIDVLLALPPQLQYSLAVFSVLFSLIGQLPDQTRLQQLSDNAIRFWKTVQVLCVCLCT